MSRELVDSGIVWLGNYPKEWKYNKGKFCYSIKTGKCDAEEASLNGEYPFFTCSMLPKKIDKYSFDCEALLVAGNGIVGYTQYYNGKFDAYQRTYVLSDFNKDILVEYLKLYVSNLLTRCVQLKSVGSVIEFIKLNDLKQFDIVYPNKQEQRKILDYLIPKNSQLNKLIKNQINQIKKMNEYKCELIYDKCFNGLNESQRIYDMTPYIKSMSKDFKLQPISSLFKIRKVIIGCEPQKVLSITQTGIKVKNIKSNEGQLAESYENYQIVEMGDFAMNHMDLLTGWVDISRFNGVTSPDYRVFRMKNADYISKYFLYVFQTYYRKRVFFGFGQGVSYYGRWRLPAENFKKIMIPVPNVEQQKEIVEFLDVKCSQIDRLIEIKNQKIEKLNEYKKSLIYEYVTGKKEVDLIDN